MKIKASILKLFLILPLVIIFSYFDFFLLKYLLENSIHYLVLPIAVLLFIFLVLFTYDILKWITFIVCRKPIIELTNDLLIENFQYDLSIDLKNISHLKIRLHAGRGAILAPLELRIFLKDKAQNYPINKRLNIIALRREDNEVIIFPTTLLDNKQIVNLCNMIVELNPEIKFKRLSMFDKWR